jgi:hypothetical protein
MGATLRIWRERILVKQTEEWYDDIAIDALVVIRILKKDLNMSAANISDLLDSVEFINSKYSNLFSEIVWEWFSGESGWNKLKESSQVDEEIDRAMSAVSSLQTEFEITVNRIGSLIQDVQLIYEDLSADGRARIGEYMREVAKYDNTEISRMIEATKTDEVPQACVMAS